MSDVLEPPLDGEGGGRPEPSEWADSDGSARSDGSSEPNTRSDPHGAKPSAEFGVPDYLSGGEPDLSRPQRQSIWAVLFIIVRLLRRIGIANIGIGVVALTSGRVPGGLLAVAAAFALGLASLSVLAWWRRTFFIEDGELVTMQGIVNLTRVNIPLGRIQSVNMDQQLLHRPAGLVRARVETAGSSGAEFEFEALDRRVAMALRSAAVAVRTADGESTPSVGATTGEPAQPGERPEPEGRQLLRRSIGDLVRVAVGRSPLTDLAVLAPTVAVAFEVFEPDELLPSDAGPPSWLMALAITAAVVVGVVAFGFASTVLRNYDLTVYLEGERLRSTSGLLSTVERSSSLERVQLLSTTQNPVHRRFGIRSVSLSTVSGQIGRADAMRLVGVTDTELADLGTVVFGRPGVRPIHSISERAVPRWRMWIGLMPAIPLSVGLLLAAPAWTPVALVWMMIVFLAAPAVQRRWRFGIDRGEVVVHHGVLTHRTARLAIRKTQAVTLHRGLFHRRYGLATVRIHTAARDVSIPHIAVSDASAIRDRLLAHVESRADLWM